MRANWSVPVSGNWAVASNWKAGQIPGVTDRVVLGSGGYTVSLFDQTTIASFEIAAGVTLEIDNFSLTSKIGTGTGTMAGTLRLTGGAHLNIDSIGVRNTGVIQIDNSTMSLGPNAKLTGGGEIHLFGNAQFSGPSAKTDNDFFSESNASNVSIYIASLEVGGTVQNNGSARLSLNAATNAGLIVSTNGDLFAQVSKNSGVIRADSGGYVRINDVINRGLIEAHGVGSKVDIATANGGTYDSSDGGLISVLYLDGTGTAPVTNLGEMEVRGGVVGGVIHNKGQIISGGNNGYIILETSVVFDGKGVVDNFNFASFEERTVSFNNVDNTLRNTSVSGESLNVTNGKLGANS